LSSCQLPRDELERQILDIIVEQAVIDPARITPDSTIESLAVESMDIVMILMAIEEKWGVYVPVDGGIAEAKDLSGFVRGVADHILNAHA
jgi:acyl carrier protein